MSTTESTETTPESTESTTYPELAGDALACGFCGAAVHNPSQQGTFTLTPMAALRGNAITPYRGPEIAFATCRGCAARHAEAQRILAAHPGIRRRFGADNAQHRLSGALDGCAALGVKPPKNLIGNRDLVLHLMAVMVVPGVNVRWLRLFGPVIGTVSPSRSAGVAWSQMPPELREELRKAYASVLAYRVAQDGPDQQIPCPDGSGCLLCGVAALAMRATRVVALGGATGAVAAAWSPRTVPLASIGGKSGRTQVEGHLCPVCDEAVAYVGSIGPSAMARALSKHLRAVGDQQTASQLDAAAREDAVEGIVGHAVLGGPGATEPWAHLQLGETFGGVR
ncbi:hypothetical protein [Brachybacterium sp. NPDC056505]|uniref:hypothetical protein n=1 Tax=Brachybacterium sp. NPDC056505 TaxID=3345843 RepID=UPI00366B3B09